MYTIDTKPSKSIGFHSKIGKNLKAIPNTKAIKRLDPGPAKLTFAEPYLSLKLNGFTGTGFAQPNIMPPPVIVLIKIRNPGTSKDPIGSR